MLWPFLPAFATGSSLCRELFLIAPEWSPTIYGGPKDRFPGIVLMDTSYFGRRTVYVWGMAAMAIELCIIGILNPWTKKTSVGWAQAIMTLVWTFTFQLSAGQLGETDQTT